MNAEERDRKLAELEAQRLAARARAEIHRERALAALERLRRLVDRTR
jgi:uncharacterized membrane protein YqiK